MRFLISLLALRPGRIGGTETYIRELLAALPSCLDGDEVSVVMSRHIQDEVPTPGLGRILLEPSPPMLMGLRMAEAFIGYRARGIERTIELFAPQAMLFPQISIFPRRVAVPCAVTVGDMQHLVHPDNFALIDRLFRASIYPFSLARAERVLSVSDRTRDELIEHARVPAEKISVIPLGVRPARVTTAALPVAPPYLYFPAATNPHKGHDVLLESLAIAIREHGLPHTLVLSGQQTAHWRHLERQVRRLGLQERVVHVGYVARETVDALYAGADAVVFPSRYEGFGLPVVEAAAAGTRVIVSRLAAFDEQGTRGVTRIDFADPAQLVRGIAEGSRAELREDAWTWERTARATLEVLRAIAV